MNAGNHVRNGFLKLPIGYRFRPTDEELIVHYLNRKVLSLPLPASIIPELDVLQINPWDLPGDLKEKRYFFTKRRVNSNQRSSVCNGSGFWKVIGRDKQIVATGSNQTVGMKKSLVFHQGKRSSGSRTHWIMHQFTTQRFMMQMEEWVVCCIYQKEKKSAGKKMNKKNMVKTKNEEVIKPSLQEGFMIMEDRTDVGPLQPSSSCSSGITDVSSSAFNIEFNQEADSNYYTTL